jgi:hypothetical protein
MQRTISEQRVLQRLGIQDFRHMTKDKIMRFATMLPYMDPEVAKKALEQFPAFKDLAGQLVIEYKNIVSNTLTDNSESQKAFYVMCNSVLDSLKQELQNDNLSAEERGYIEDRMLSVAAMIAEKDSENKRFLLKVITVVGFFVTGIIGIAAATLGSNFQTPGINDADAINA